MTCLNVPFLISYFFKKRLLFETAFFLHNPEWCRLSLWLHRHCLFWVDDPTAKLRILFLPRQKKCFYWLLHWFVACLLAFECCFALLDMRRCAADEYGFVACSDRYSLSWIHMGSCPFLCSGYFTTSKMWFVACVVWNIRKFFRFKARVVHMCVACVWERAYVCEIFTTSPINFSCFCDHEKFYCVLFLEQQQPQHKDCILTIRAVLKYRSTYFQDFFGCCNVQLSKHCSREQKKK